MRPRARPGAVSAVGSILVHATAVAIAFGVAASAPDLEQFVSYNIELVSMPGPDLGDLVVEAPPSPPSEAPPPEPQPVVSEPEPVEDEPEPAAAPAPTPPRPTQARPNPSSGASSGESGEELNIRMEGLRRDYPAYYTNIILQIKRCFRWQGQGSPQTEVYFVINADGTVSDLRFLKQSGNPTFDYEALGAIECAGQSGRLGALPEALGFDRLEIRFNFRPGTVGGIFR